MTRLVIESKEVHSSGKIGKKFSPYVSLSQPLSSLPSEIKDMFTNHISIIQETDENLDDSMDRPNKDILANRKSVNSLEALGS